MNYLKKIKSLGFKKIPAIVICKYTDPKLDGFYIENLSSCDEDKRILYPRFRSHINKIHTYVYKINETFNIYIIIVGEEYTVVIEDLLAHDDISYSDFFVYKNTVKVLMHSNKLSDDFWKIIVSKLGKDIQREILIKNILKNK